MENNLRWYCTTRQKLPGLLVGIERPEGPWADAPERVKMPGADALVGYRSDALTNDRSAAPNVVLIDRFRVPELFAWLHTYSEESFPISHYCQVRTFEDWQLLTASGVSSESSQRIVPALSSTIVGEMLAQSESDLNLANVPLSWAGGCFTLTMHTALQAERAGGQGVAKIGAERLRRCESDSRFGRRPLSVNDLTPMWAFLGQGAMVGTTLHEICRAVIAALDPRASLSLQRTEALYSNSAEDRVRGFDVVVDEVMAMAKSKAHRPVAACLLAAAALLVGGGTSHLELLRPLQSELPESLGWFGLIAGLAGPVAWDPNWLRLVKGVERQLHVLSASAPTGGEADLAWIEYEWLSAQSSSERAFGGFPKRNQRALVIEILPGAPCQFRLVAPQEGSARAANRLVHQPSELPLVPEARRLVDSAVHESPQWQDVQRAAADLVALIEAAAGKQKAEVQPGLFAAEQPKTTRKAKPRGKTTVRR